MSMAEELAGSVWEREAQRLVEHWREIAAQLEPYAPGASAAYLRAGEELEARLNGSEKVAESLEALSTKLQAASREAIHAAIAEHRKQVQVAREAASTDGGSP